MKRSIVGFAAWFAAVLVACGSNGGRDGDAGGGAEDGMPSGDGATGFTEAGAVCPALQPTVGTPCSIQGTCVYGPNLCCGEGFECTGGRWQPVDAGCACIGVPTDASGTVPDATSDGGFVDGAACPTSCTTDADCDPCPQKSFGGYVCMAGVCRFLG